MRFWNFIWYFIFIFPQNLEDMNILSWNLAPFRLRSGKNSQTSGTFTAPGQVRLQGLNFGLCLNTRWGKKIRWHWPLFSNVLMTSPALFRATAVPGLGPAQPACVKRYLEQGQFLDKEPIIKTTGTVRARIGLARTRNKAAGWCSQSCGFQGWRRIL
jgi:hypothetical protein